jgi:hypothetical protein
MNVDVAEPGQLRTSVALTVAGAWDLAQGVPGVTVSAAPDAGTRVDVAVQDGRTVSVELTRTIPPAPQKPPGCGCEAPGAELSLLALTLLALRRRR